LIAPRRQIQMARRYYNGAARELNIQGRAAVPHVAF
jgi:hypothetical protein